MSRHTIEAMPIAAKDYTGYPPHRIDPEYIAEIRLKDMEDPNVLHVVLCTGAEFHVEMSLEELCSLKMDLPR